jgi:Transcription factor Tfb2
MLDLFVDLKVRMPNMVQGVISRESIRKALTTGVKAQQILDFLKYVFYQTLSCHLAAFFLLVEISVPPPHCICASNIVARYASTALCFDESNFANCI